MEKIDKEIALELRSEEVQEILGRPPKWIIRIGISFIFIIVIGLFIGSYYIKYPDILQSTIVVTTENLPAGVTAKASGRIDTLLVSEKSMVQKGELLAVIENPAHFDDILLLKKKIELFLIDSIYICSYEPFSELRTPDIQLGDLQSTYFGFIKAYEDLRYFITANYHQKKIAVVEKQIITQKSILKKTEQQLSYSTRQVETAKQVFRIDSTLYEKKTISLMEYEQAKNTYLQQLQSFESSKMGLDNQRMSILQLEQSIFDLQQQRTEQLNTLTISLNGALDQLKAQIKTWELNFLLVAPCSGMATFTKYWQENQNVNAGEVIVTIVPQGEAQIVGKISLPPQGAGKVKVGQTVNVKLDNFPYMEYGMIKVTIQNISLVPVQVDEETKAYILEVVFPKNLTTTYGKKLTFTQEMTGSAEIITEDLRLLDKFINPIKAVVRK